MYTYYFKFAIYIFACSQFALIKCNIHFGHCMNPYTHLQHGGGWETNNILLSFFQVVAVIGVLFQKPDNAVS